MSSQNEFPNSNTHEEESQRLRPFAGANSVEALWRTIQEVAESTEGFTTTLVNGNPVRYTTIESFKQAWSRGDVISPEITETLQRIGEGGEKRQAFVSDIAAAASFEDLRAAIIRFGTSLNYEDTVFLKKDSGEMVRCDVEGVLDDLDASQEKGRSTGVLRNSELDSIFTTLLQKES